MATRQGLPASRKKWDGEVLGGWDDGPKTDWMEFGGTFVP